MGELVFIGNIYVFIVTMVSFVIMTVVGHLYLIKVKMSKRFDKLSSILNIILSVILFIILLVNFEFNNGKVIEDKNNLDDNVAVASNTAVLPIDLRVIESNKNLENMLNNN